MSLLERLTRDATLRIDLMDVLKEMGNNKSKEAPDLSPVGIKRRVKKVKG